ncbi:MAG: hypothetical protein DMG57_26475 [Acidobacteria bacterium]|nr:MAG: hypothetical protein DMG57_26475 [Acidobacteriota bacterium]
MGEPPFFGLSSLLTIFGRLLPGFPTLSQMKLVTNLLYRMIDNVLGDLGKGHTPCNSLVRGGRRGLLT